MCVMPFVQIVLAIGMRMEKHFVCAQMRILYMLSRKFDHNRRPLFPHLVSLASNIGDCSLIMLDFP
jgi:hypothetical protein